MSQDRERLFAEEMRLIDTRIMLNRLIALNLQLFRAITNYARRNNIPLPYDFKIMRLIKEIEETDTEVFPTDESLQGDKSRKLPYKRKNDQDPGELPEPMAD